MKTVPVSIDFLNTILDLLINYQTCGMCGTDYTEVIENIDL